MKQRILLLTALCIALLLALTGCSNAGNAVSNAASKVGEDVSNAMSRVESFLEGGDASSTLRDDDTTSSRLTDDGFTSSGTLDDGSASSDTLDDGLASNGIAEGDSSAASEASN